MNQIDLGAAMHACNPSTPEAETGGSRVQVQSGLSSKTLSQKGEGKI